MTGCNNLVSLHMLSDLYEGIEKPKPFTYVSHSIKEVFDNIQKVPEKFSNQSAFHLCTDPQIQWLSHEQKVATVHDHPDLFKPQNTSGPDALAKEIIANVTNDFESPEYEMYLGDSIYAGIKQCSGIRLDWEPTKKFII